MSTIPAGYVFHGPDGQSYRVNADIDINGSEPVPSGAFEPQGGAPTPTPKTPMPPWLLGELRAFLYATRPAKGKVSG